MGQAREAQCSRVGIELEKDGRNIEEKEYRQRNKNRREKRRKEMHREEKERSPSPSFLGHRGRGGNKSPEQACSSRPPFWFLAGDLL